MIVEIAICTWNRSQLLTGTLESITRLAVPAGVTLRVIVVDNNSTDSTKTVLKSFADRLDLQSEHEPRQGHTFARNRAIDSAAGELLLWTDDDVVLNPNWLSANLEAAKNQDFDFWGGKIEPVFQGGKPAWIAENWESLKGCFACRDLGNEPLEFTETRLPYGANFAIRTELQKKFAFDTTLGRRADEVEGEDEIELMKRLIKAGHRGQWVPDSSLEHIITADRSSMEYVQEYFVGQGRRIFQEEDGWSNVTTTLWRFWKWESLLFWLKRKYAKPPAYVAHLIRSGLAKGQYLESKQSLHS